MTIYLWEPDFDGILSAVYEAWMSGKGHENVKLELDRGVPGAGAVYPVCDCADLPGKCPEGDPGRLREDWAVGLRGDFIPPP